MLIITQREMIERCLRVKEASRWGVMRPLMGGVIRHDRKTRALVVALR
jgi:hypothetical protein